MDEISYSGAPASPKRKLSKRLILFLIFFLVIIALIAGVFYFVTKDSSEAPSEPEDALIIPEDNLEEITEEPTPTEEEEEDQSPTPSAAEEEDEEEADTSSAGSIAVQNGSGEAGVAGEASTALKSAGFSIASTGNADNFNYEGVTIQVKNSKKSILSDIEEALSKDYTISDTSTDLPESTNYDALVIIGK